MISRQCKWQKKKRAKGLCICCGKPAGARPKGRPWATSRKTMTHCPRCREAKNSQRRVLRAIKLLDSISPLAK